MFVNEFNKVRKYISIIEQELNEFRLFLDPDKLDEYLNDINQLKAWLYEVEEYLYNNNDN